MSSQRQIGMLLFPRLTQLDLTGPYEVLARLPNTAVHLVAQGLDPVKTDRGLMIVPTVTYADCPQLDVVVVPGGPGQQELMEDEVVLGFLRSQAAAREIRDVGLHRIPGARSGWSAQGQTCHLPLGRHRASHGAWRGSGARTRRRGRQRRDLRRRCFRNRFRADAGGDPGGRAGGPRDSAPDRV